MRNEVHSEHFWILNSHYVMPPCHTHTSTHTATPPISHDLPWQLHVLPVSMMPSDVSREDVSVLMLIQIDIEYKEFGPTSIIVMLHDICSTLPYFRITLTFCYFILVAHLSLGSITSWLFLLLCGSPSELSGWSTGLQVQGSTVWSQLKVTTFFHDDWY